MFNLQPLRHISTLPDNDQIADVVGLLFWANSGLMHRSKQPLYSIT